MDWCLLSYVEAIVWSFNPLLIVHDSPGDSRAMEVQAFGQHWGESLAVIGFGFTDQDIACHFSGLQGASTVSFKYFKYCSVLP